MRFGAVLKIRKSYGAVRFGFENSKSRNPMVRFGAVLKIRNSYGAVGCGVENSKILRCGSVRF